MEQEISVPKLRHQLSQIGQNSGLPLQEIASYFVYERLLYRLSVSEYMNLFVLKGGLLVKVWFDEHLRLTRDVDFLGFGPPVQSKVLAIFKEILSQKQNDGIKFDIDGLTTAEIRQENEYGGIQLKTKATLGSIVIHLKIDIGYGDVIVPPDAVIEYPTLLNFPTPRLRTYSKEAVIAEKFHAISQYKEWSSRMKDYFDVWKVAESFEIDSRNLALSIHATFTHRNTKIPTEVPPALSDNVLSNPLVLKVWQLFVERNTPYESIDFSVVLHEVKEFLMHHAKLANELASETN